MAAPISNDRKLAAEVRRLGLLKIKRIFELPVVEMSDREKDIHDEILKRMAPNLIPRLHEHTGEDGDPIKYQVVSYADNPAQVPTETISNSVTESV